MKLQTLAELKLENEKRAMRKKAERVNDKSPTHALEHKSDLASVQMRRKNGNAPILMVKPEGAATPPTWNTLRDPGTYNGAELRPFEGRPGSMDAYKLPSRGL